MKRINAWLLKLFRKVLKKKVYAVHNPKWDPRIMNNMLKESKLTKDYSSECNMDDDDTTNPCWECTYFNWPIGCMKNEVMKERNNGSDLLINDGFPGIYDFDGDTIGIVKGTKED